MSLEDKEMMVTDTTSSSNKQRVSRRRSSTAASPSSSNSVCSNSSSKRSKRTYVEHTYADHYNDPIYSPGETEEDNGEAPKRRGPRGGVVVPFPERLYTMLSQVEKEGYEDVVSWQPHGRCFIVHQPKRFVEEVMPKYFRQSKLTSFQRQVNLYGFRRLTAGKDRGGYYHELFLRGRPDLHRRLVRIRVKGTGFKSASSPATEPDFYTYPRCSESGPSMTNPQPAVAQSNNDVEAVADVAMSCDTSSILEESSTEPAWQPLEAPPKMVASTPEMKPLETPKLVSLSDIKCSSATTAHSSFDPWKVGSGPMSLSSFAKSIVCDSQSFPPQEPCPVTPETNMRQLVSQELDSALSLVNTMDSPDYSPFPSMVSLTDVSTSTDYEEDLLAAPLPLPSEESRMASFQDVDILLSSKDLAADPIVDNILISNVEVPSDYNLDPLLLLDEVTGPVGCL